MTGSDRPTLGSGLLKRLEALRARFGEAGGAATRGGQPPSVDTFLRDTVEPERSIILQELSAIEQHRRGRPPGGAEGPGGAGPGAPSAVAPGGSVGEGSMETLADGLSPTRVGE